MGSQQDAFVFRRAAGTHDLIDILLTELVEMLGDHQLLVAEGKILLQVRVCPICHDKVFVADGSRPVHLLQIMQNSALVVSVQWVLRDHSILATDIRAVEGQPEIKINAFKMWDGEVASACRHAQ